MFSSESITTLLPTRLAGLPVACEPVVTSTNAVMRERLAALPGPQLLVAGAQTQGVGRHGKGFFSPAHTGIYMTYGGFAFSDAEMPLITPAAGVALQQAAHELFGVTTQIKWVNDVLLDGRKVAGILAARLADGQVLIGVGVNIAPAQSAPDVPIDLPVGTLLKQAPTQELRPALAAAWLTHFDALLAAPETIMPAYRQHAAWLHQAVVVNGLHDPKPGVVAGFGERGELLLATDHGTEVFATGSIRLA